MDNNKRYTLSRVGFGSRTMLSHTTFIDNNMPNMLFGILTPQFTRGLALGPALGKSRG